ncbi:centromere protein S-like isoform 1 [Corchorus olitorius]|uniref:Centromere protein S-like isoform 1 n=1 Tax=Corchorus olitorius TaxID=93759 RepID=A0A1R3G2Q1_9ROSI|nr:centromere protein S-like isoform 1 [Corchorus olitorius]
MEVDEDRSDFEKEEEEFHDEDDSLSEVLRDRFRLSAISIAEAEGQLAKDLEIFAQHAGRKLVKMEDVIVSGNLFFYNFQFQPHGHGPITMEEV